MPTDNIQNPIQTSDSPPITVILTIILLAFFFIGFFSFYFGKCFMQNLFFTLHLGNSPVTTQAPTGPFTDSSGLDPKIIQTFPCFEYSSVKDYRKEKYGLECAICLVEFSNEDMLRLLPLCCHVFHQECIDLWLQNHATCPVCRRSLNIVLSSPEKSPLSCNNSTHQTNDSELPGDDIRITINDEDEDEREGSKRDEKPPPGNVDNNIEGHNEKVENIFKSNSTGHSRVNDEDRFTLRLPEDVKGKIIGQHNVSKSCTTFGDCSKESL